MDPATFAVLVFYYSAIFCFHVLHLLVLLVGWICGTKCYCPKYQQDVQWMGSSFQIFLSLWAQEAIIPLFSSSDTSSGAKLI